ncbi:MAG: response regulator, partial [Proteobacteria bacterium]|nr:response regulator [Pseudomonadota bacterium]
MKRILVADDSVTIQKVIALTFADEPFEVKSVGTGTEALEVMRTWKPDVLLADVIMPQMNGYELCRAVKGNPETGSLPVLLLAGTFEAFDEEEAGSVGADDYITKPFESGELIEKVQTLTSPKEAPEEILETPVAGVPDAREVAPAAHVFSPPKEPVSESPGFEASPFPEEEVSPGAEKPSWEPAPENSAPEVYPSAPESPASASPAGGSEPDIWDILSEVEDLVPGSMAGPDSERVSGLNPVEEKGVIDVGSFDVGLDRPESSPAPFEPEPESW